MGELRLTALGALDGLGLGEGGAALLLALTRQAGPLGLRLRGGDGGKALGLGLLDPGHPQRLGLLLRLVAAGIGGLADLGVELSVGQRGLPLGHLFLLGQDLLLPVGVGQRSGGVRLGRGSVGLGLDLGLAQVQGALRDRDLLLGLQPGLFGGPAGVGLGDVGLLLGAGGLGPAEILQVGALGGDVLDLEGVQDEALAGEAGLGLLRDLPGEGGPVADDVLDRHPADDGPQRAGQHLLGEADDAVLLLEETLGRGADGVLVAADLDDRDAFEIGLDAAQGDRSADGDGDVPAGQVEGVALLDEGHDEHAAADHDLLAAGVGEDLSGGRIGGLLAAPAGDEERLTGTGDLVAGDDDQGEQHEEYDHSHGRNDD